MPKPIPLRPPVVLAADRVDRDAGGGPATPAPATPSELLRVAAERLARGVFVAVATVIARRGSAPSTPGQKVLLAADGTCLGTVGGGAIEREVLAALDAMVAASAGDPAPAERPSHEVRTFKLGAELGMCCGGAVDVLLEPMLARVPCLVVGAGHVAAATAPLLAKLGFAVTVADEREATLATRAGLEGVATFLGTWDEAGRDMPKDGVVLVMTHDHALDQHAIEWALRQGFAFVGGVGSRAKAARTRDRLLAKGFSEEQCARVRMPIGVEIGARLPDEIAVAIAAELVRWKRHRA